MASYLIAGAATVAAFVAQHIQANASAFSALPIVKITHRSLQKVAARPALAAMLSWRVGRIARAGRERDDTLALAGPESEALMARMGFMAIPPVVPALA